MKLLGKNDKLKVLLLGNKKVIAKGKSVMKRKRYLALAVAAGVLAQPVLSAGVPLEAKAAEETYVTVGELTNKGTQVPKKDRVVPSENQYEYQKQELAAFCHFGMNTYTGSEWGSGKEDPKQFQLKNSFDAETYVKAISDAGFQKLIITAKHHDGFCIWPSQYTEHDTETAGYQGDVLAELSKACTKYDVDMGLYLSPWDVNSKYYGYYDENGNPLTDQNGNPKDGMTWDQVEEKDVLDYNEYYDNQLKEILGNDKYGNDGHFKEIWMDGAKGSGSAAQNYDFDRWFDTIQSEEGTKAGKYTDDCLQFGSGGYTTVHWIGNESGLANEETWAKAKADRENNKFDANTQNTSGGKFAIGYPDGNQWSVPEADTKITAGWFWGPNKKTPLSMEQLADIYFRSVGHNATLLLNIPPNREGTVDKDILARVAEFGTTIKDTFDDNLAANSDPKATEVRGKDRAYSPANVLDGDDNTYWTVEDGTSSASLLLDLKETKTFDVISIEEAIQFGQRIGSFKVEYQNQGGEWKTFEEGTTIGAKRLCRKMPVKADKIKITVTTDEKAENKAPILSEVGVYCAAEGFSLGNGIPSDLQVVDNPEFTRSEGWNDEIGSQIIGGTSMWINGNPNNQPWAETKFTGTKVWLMGTIDPNHGPADVYIDGEKVASIDTHSSSRKVAQRIFESETLEDKEHTVRIVNIGTNKQALGLDAALVLNNGGKGMIEIEKSSYRVNEDVTMPITLKRVGGTSGEVKVQFEVSPGSAWQKHFNADGSMEVTFADGQDTAEASITTKRVTDKEGDLYFNIGLASPTGGAIVGFNSSVKVVIADTESYSKADLEKKIKEVEAADYQESLYTTSSYQALQEALKQAKKIVKQANPPIEEVAKAGSALDVAVASLTKREVFSPEDAFMMPKIKGTNKTVEAEYFILDASKAEDKNRYVRIATDSKASNGKKISWFEPGNVVKLPFYAEKAGTYTFEATYQCGRDASNPNKLNWSGTHVENGTIDVTGKNLAAPEFETCTFEVKVTEPGAGELVFTADKSASPNLDKFVVTATDVASKTFEIAVKAGEHGSIDGVEGDKVSVEEGASKTFTFVPEEGYAVKDVIVDGVSVGPMSSYTFEEVLENGHSIEVTFEKELYAEDNRFEFPVDGAAKTLEAERFQLTNTGENEKYELQISKADWASGGKFVNALNHGDFITLYYHAEQAGTYTVSAYYRSGSDANALAWAEKENKIEAGNVSAGAPNTSETHQAEFTWKVTEPGDGCLVFTAPETDSPQLDKFEIKSSGTPVPPLNAVALKAAVEEAAGIQLDDYKDGEAKENFKTQLAAAQELLKQIEEGGKEITQDRVDEVTKALTDAQEKLEEKEQIPAVDKEQLKKAIAKAEALDLSKYQEEGKAELEAALQHAKEVLANEKADADMVSKATFDLNTAIANLKPIESGDGGDDNDHNNGKPDGGNGSDHGNNSQGNQGNGNTSAVQTGDTQNPFIFLVTMVLAGAATIFGFKKKMHGRS